MAKTKRQPVNPLERFHKHFSSTTQWADRWAQTLYPALLHQTRYTTLRNRLALEADFQRVMQAIPQLERINLTAQSNNSNDTLLECYISSADQDAGASTKPFPEPVKDQQGLYTHWNLDLASLLAVSILDVQPGDKVLDLCAAPGGKSIAMSQSIFSTTQNAGCLHANEFDHARMKRLEENLKLYIPIVHHTTSRSICLHQDGTSTTLRFPLGMGGYDKVLLDAPCSSERHIVHAQDRASRSGPGRIADELSRWSPAMAKRLAETQVKLLQNALRSVRIGGRVLYATCSISKEENDEVVDAAIRWSTIQYKKNAITWTCQCEVLGDGKVEHLEAWAEHTQHGWIVLPDKRTPYGADWGPLYFAVLTKVKPAT